MKFGPIFTIAAGLVLVAVSARAESRSAAMVVRVNVVRGCSVDSNTTGAPEGSVNLTCTRSGSPTGVNVGSSLPGVPARVVPMRPRQTMTLVPARPAVMAGGTQTARIALATRQIVTLNF